MIHINTTALAFYTNLEQQSFRVDYAMGNKYSLISPANRFLPFQIILPSDTAALTAAKVVTLEGVERNVLGHFSTSTLSSFTGYKVFKYEGLNMLTPALDIGLQYLVLTFGETKMYSELFSAQKTVRSTETIQISYWDTSDFVFQHTLGRIIYNGTYQNKIYIPSLLAKPEYTLEEVVEERDGFKFVEKQIQKKLYRFSFLAPEYLCDVLSTIPMHDSVVIVYNGKIYPVYDILFTPEWTPDGFLANVDVEFTTDAIIKKIGKVFPTRSLGDFNNDFSNDFSVI